MSTDLEAALDDCLAHLAAGEAVDTCLTVYPGQAESLRPLLATAARLQALPLPEARPEAVAAGRERMLAAMRASKQAARVERTPLLDRFASFFVGGNRGPRYALRLAAVSLVVLIVAANVGLMVASAASLPGDQLYQVKRTWEEARLLLTVGERNREQLQQEFGERRLHEVRALMDAGREGVLDVEGALHPAGANRWEVDGFTVQITPNTVVTGRLAAGVWSKLRIAVQRDGSAIALKVVALPGRQVADATGVAPSYTPADREEPTLTPEPVILPTMPGGPTDMPARPERSPTVDDRGAAYPATVQPTETPEPGERPTRSLEPPGWLKQTVRPPDRPRLEPQASREPKPTAEPPGRARHTATPTDQARRHGPPATEKARPGLGPDGGPKATPPAPKAGGPWIEPYWTRRSRVAVVDPQLEPHPGSSRGC